MWGLHLMHALGQGFRRRLQHVVSEGGGEGVERNMNGRSMRTRTYQVPQNHVGAWVGRQVIWWFWGS